ncbi:MAG TPA: phosphate signaling complex protein PhoU [Caulobacteraceae bacterium]|jgi:phosphate transport system protein
MNHTVAAYEDELRDLSSDVEQLGLMAVVQLRDALAVLSGGDGTPAQEIMAADKRLNAAAQEIERKAVRLIALRQPMADDLRHTIVALKCALELERCGDLAKNIAKRSLRMDVPIPPPLLEQLEQLGAMAGAALEGALRAMVARDVEGARAVWRSDPVLDERHEALVRDLLEQMSRDPGLTAAGAQLLFMAKNLERIGDHAGNIAEMVCYQATGSSAMTPAA